MLTTTDRPTVNQFRGISRRYRGVHLQKQLSFEIWESFSWSHFLKVKWSGYILISISCYFTFQISDCDLLYWRELVSKCLADYSSAECCKPDHKKLVWIVSRRTAQNLQNSYYSVPELPTIPEGGCFNESERLVILSRHLNCGVFPLSGNANLSYCSF